MGGNIVVHRSRMARSAAVLGVLSLGGLAVLIAVLVLQTGPRPKFDATQFRAARRRSDTGVMQTQARLAVEQRALVGMPAARVRAALGTPTHNYRRSARMVWQVDGVDASGSLGTKLEVRLDARMQRVVDAQLDPRYD